MRHKQHSYSLLFRTSSRAATVMLAITIGFALTGVLTRSAHSRDLPTNDIATPLPSPDEGQHGRAFPRLSLGSGSELVYVGMFPSNGSFRGSSKFARFLDAMNVPLPNVGPPVGSAEQAAIQRDVPPWMLSSDVRVVDDTEPPGDAMALPETRSLPGSVRDAVVSLVYGPPRVLRTPRHLTTDSRQRVIVSDSGIPAVHVLDPKKKTSFSILGGQGRRLQSPAGVAVDGEDNIYVADSKRGMVFVYDRYGTFLRRIGNFHGENMYQHPTGIAIDRKAGHLYLADSPRHLVLMLDLEGNLLKRVGKQSDEPRHEGLQHRGDGGSRAFNYPTEIALSDSQVAVLDTAGARVQIMDLECNLLSGFSVLNTSRQKVERAEGLALDRAGNIYVSYVGTSEVRMYAGDGGLLTSFGQTGPRMGEFSAPRGLWVDAKNRLYVADTENARVQVFQLINADQSNSTSEVGK